MHLLLFSFFFILQGVPSDTTNIESEIQSATVFLEGAEVHRQASVSLKSGTNHLVFTGLSRSLNEETMQLRTDGDIILESIAKSVDVNYDGSYTEDLKKLTTEKEQIENAIKQKQADLRVLNKKLEVLTANQDLNGENGSITPTQLKQAVDYFEAQFQLIEEKRIEINTKLEELNKQLAGLNQKLRELQRKQKQRSGIISMSVQSKTTRSTVFDLSYVVPDARWYPSYDVRVEDVNKPLDLIYQANISQNTGVNWDDIDLTISSAQPQQNTNLPSINPVYVGFYQPSPLPLRRATEKAQPSFSRLNLQTAGQQGIQRISGTVRDAQTGEPLPGTNVYSADTEEGDNADQNGRYSFSVSPDATLIRFSYIGYEMITLPITSSTMNANMTVGAALDEVVVTGYGEPIATQLQQGQTAFSFTIKTPYTVKSGAAEKTVAVQTYTLPATYEYISIPKKETSAYLTAKVDDWESLNLLSGEANLFLDQSYVGKSELNLNTVQDTLSFSLGKDKGIVVERSQIESFREKNFFGNKVTETKGWNIKIRNAKSAPVTISVTDQVPISTNEDIEVDLKEKSGAMYNKSTGKLTWQITLDPSESKTLSFVYETSYPSGKTIIQEEQ